MALEVQLRVGGVLMNQFNLEEEFRYLGTFFTVAGGRQFRKHQPGGGGGEMWEIEIETKAKT